MTAQITDIAARRRACSDEQLFPGAYIVDGPELDRALGSLGLERETPRPRRRLGALVTSALAWALMIAGLCVMLWGAADFVVAELSRFNPGPAQ